MLYVSPTEPRPLRDIGTVSMISEEYGCDIYWAIGEVKYGIQRKEFPNDFIASMHDGRLGEQIKKMGGLDYPILICEGRELWTTEGALIRNGGKRWPYSRSQHRRLLASIQAEGVQVHHSEGLYDTIQLVGELKAWSEKPEHLSLQRRGGRPSTDSWGRVGNKDWQKWFLQGLPGVGPKQAEAILQHIGFPIRLNATIETLRSVPGIGIGRATKIYKVFQGS